MYFYFNSFFCRAIEWTENNLPPLYHLFVGDTDRVFEDKRKKSADLRMKIILLPYLQKPHIYCWPECIKVYYLSVCKCCFILIFTTYFIYFINHLRFVGCNVVSRRNLKYENQNFRTKFWTLRSPKVNKSERKLFIRYRTRELFQKLKFRGFKKFV